MSKLIVFALAAALLSGCSSMNAAVVGDPTEPAPVNYRAIAADGLRQILFDPYSVRDAQISKPTWLGSWSIGEGNGWVVCFKGNAKNRFGAYTGAQEMALMIRGGKVISNQGELPPNGYHCGSAEYSDFPEIMEQM